MGQKTIFTQSTSSSLNNGSKDISYTEMKRNVRGIIDDINELLEIVIWSAMHDNIGLLCLKLMMRRKKGKKMKRLCFPFLKPSELW